MKNFLLLSITVALAFSNFGCKTSKESNSSTTSTNTSSETTLAAKPQLLASIQRTACYGQCPMYKATFMDNGEVKYVGKRFVEKLGTYSGLISEEQILEIQSKIKEYEYFKLDSLYPTPISDFPSCITEARLDGVSKKVIDRRNPPANLKAFEKFLDSLLEDVELTKVSDITNYDQPLE